VPQKAPHPYKNEPLWDALQKQMEHYWSNFAQMLHLIIANTVVAIFGAQFPTLMQKMLHAVTFPFPKCLSLNFRPAGKKTACLSVADKIAFGPNFVGSNKSVPVIYFQIS
jgi:hypothetical protein